MKKDSIKKVSKYFLYALLVTVLFTSCSVDLNDVNSGQMKHIPYTNNYAIGTDSTIVIIERESGKTLNIIKRKR